MAIDALEPLDHRNIPDAGLGIDLGRRAAFDSFGDLQLRFTETDGLAHQIVLCEWVQPFEEDVAAKPSCIQRRATEDIPRDRVDRRAIEKRDEARARIHEAETWRRGEQRDGTAKRVAHIALEEALDRRSTGFLADVSSRHDRAALADLKAMARIVKTRFEPRETLMAHQHEELDLGLVFGGTGIEARRSVLQSKEPIAGKMGTSFQSCLGDFLG